MLSIHNLGTICHEISTETYKTYSSFPKITKFNVLDKFKQTSSRLALKNTLNR